MASAPAAGANPRSFAVAFGASSTDGALTFQEAVLHAQGMKLLGPHDRPIVTQRPIGVLKASDLPLRMMPDSATQLVNFVDVVCDFDAQPDYDRISDLMVKGDYESLPEKLRLKVTPTTPYTMQLCILPHDGNTTLVLKHVNFNGVKVNAVLVKSMCIGQPCVLDYGKHLRIGGAAFNHMLDQLGGFQIRYWTLAPKGTPKSSIISAEARRAGFEFIRKFGPKSNNENQFVEWTEHHVNEPCPIQGWERGLVKESLRNYSAGKVLAKTIRDFPLTLKDIVPWFTYDVLVNFLKDFDEFSILWVGKSGVGKTPVTKIIAQVVSKYLIERDNRTDLQPSFRTAKNLDFFRGEPGSVYKPDVFDDGILAKQTPDTLKFFHDPSEDDALVWARWGGSFFEKNQFRQSVSNPYDATAEPQKEDERMISHAGFVSMIAPTFHKDFSPEDVVSFLKRTHIVLFSEKWVYYRRAGTDPVGVPRIPYPGGEKDLLTPESKEAYGMYRKGRPFERPAYTEDMTWAVEFLRKVDRGEVIPRAHTITGRTLFSSAPSTRFWFPPLMPSAELAVKVKRERAFAFARKFSKSSTVIDLDSPSPKKLCVSSGSASSEVAEAGLSHAAAAPSGSASSEVAEAGPSRAAAAPSGSASSKVAEAGLSHAAAAPSGSASQDPMGLGFCMDDELP